MSYANLKAMLRAADAIDVEEGRLAYPRYHDVMRSIADHYGFGLVETVAAFAALSPNNDYIGNLRSLVSVLQGIRAGATVGEVTVSTYKACRDRAWLYATGETSFERTVRGPKIRAFYFNILDPSDRRHVTIDGHMVAAYRANSGTMKDNIPRRREYETIATTVRRLAGREGLVPNQVQATIWFARKRLLNVRYDPQMSLFAAADDRWQTSVRVEDIRPFRRLRPVSQNEE